MNYDNYFDGLIKNIREENSKVITEEPKIIKIDKRKKIKEPIEKKNEINILNIKNFNKNDEESIEWRKLDEKTRENYLTIYLNENKIPENMQKILIEMNKNKKLITQKHVKYDKVNKKLLSILILKKNDDGEYYIIEEIKKSNDNKKIDKLLK